MDCDIKQPDGWKCTRKNHSHFEPCACVPIAVEQQLELDCYHKAEADEPKFTLLARDPLAAYLVALWECFRKGDTANAVCIFADIVAEPAYKYRSDPSSRSSVEKLASAMRITRDMIAWREAKGLGRFEFPYITD